MAAMIQSRRDPDSCFAGRVDQFRKRNPAQSRHLFILPSTSDSFASTSSSVLSVNFRQDLPPAAGFEAIKYKRNLPLRGPGALVILGGVTAVCTFGFYRLGLGNIERRELKRETTWARIHLVPLLLAEGDRAAHQEGLRATAVETEIMKDVKGWVAGQPVYNNPRYRSPESL
ncbi:GRIM-19 protein-domain-containing protein [Mycena leptocephala]|nr:GRIM-19 protein-domain-containing protein [Mycena leptocephala]